MPDLAGRWIGLDLGPGLDQPATGFASPLVMGNGMVMLRIASMSECTAACTKQTLCMKVLFVLRSRVSIFPDIILVECHDNNMLVVWIFKTNQIV